MTVEQVARQMWRFSREEMVKGTLDALGEQTFTDGKVRKALQTLMGDPPRPFVNLVRNATGDESLARQRIKESLIRIASETIAGEVSIGFVGPGGADAALPDQSSRSVGAKKAWEARRAKQGESPYDEAHHLANKPQEAVSLYRSVDRLCLSFVPSGISRRYLAKTINYEYGKRCFCSVHVLQGGLRIWLQLKYGHIENPPAFARDVAHVGHWGAGDVELRITNRTDLDEATELIRRSFESVK
jgi:predicted transport protein